MTVCFREHPSEEALERFVRNQSFEQEIESLEMHILLCGLCIDKLEELEIEMAAARLALQSAAQRSQKTASPEKGGAWRNWFTLPKFSLAATGVVAAAGAILFSIPRDVTLTAYRGNETAFVSEGRPLRLHLNAVGLEPGEVAIELAGADGAIAWTGRSTVQHDRVDVVLPRITKSGPHYLRLYAPVSQAGADRNLLREFALSARWTL